MLMAAVLDQSNFSHLLAVTVIYFFADESLILPKNWTILQVLANVLKPLFGCNKHGGDTGEKTATAASRMIACVPSKSAKEDGAQQETSVEEASQAGPTGTEAPVEGAAGKNG